MRGLGIVLVGLGAAACSAGEGESPGGNFKVVVQYDSTLPVAKLLVAAADAQGAEVWVPSEHEAPLFLDPPGLREAVLRFERPGLATVNVFVDGVSSSGAIVGSGHAAVQLEDGVDEVRVRLGAPVICGDGQRFGREQCDDGGTAADDGCNALCMIEAGWTCAGTPSRCGRCGDDDLGPGEQCDDGNIEDGDGCSAVCELEAATQPYLLEVEALEPQSTEGADWAPVVGTELLLPAQPDDTLWVVFASGTLGSSSVAELSARAALRLDGEVVDDFSHQTLGGADNEAGFVTFHVVQQGGPVTVDVAMAADDGITTVSQVRVVAMRMVPAARPVWTAPQDRVEVTGIDLPLASLEFEVTEAGRYLVFAKGNLTENPGADTARMWLSTPEGRVPWDDGGVSFSSPRDARVPFFTARTLSLPPGKAQLDLRGTSSGSGSLDGWWNADYAFRRRITVTAGTAAVPAGYSVPITFNHQAMVQAGRARADGADVRLVYVEGGRGAELNRVVDPERGWNQVDTTVWVALPPSVPAGETFAELWLYSGAAQPGPPPEDPAAVFVLFDDFDGTALSPLWQSTQGTAIVAGGTLTLGPGTSLLGPAPQSENAAGLIVQTRLRFADAQLSGTSVYLGLAWTRDLAMGGPGFLAREGVHYYGGGAELQPYMPDTPTASHTYSIGWPDALTLAFYQDDTGVGRSAPTPGTVINPGLSLINGSQSNFEYQWLRVRRYVEPEPTVSVEPITGPAGLRPSQFDGLRILVMRVDVFDGVFSGRQEVPIESTESATVALVSLEVPEPRIPREHLVVMSSRISGDSSEQARRVGMCLANGQALLQTQHRINRDGSDATGYHHVAGVVDARTTGEAMLYQTAIRSPDGIGVQGAASSIEIIRF